MCLWPVWPFCQGTGTAHLANCITPGSAPLSIGLAITYHSAQNDKYGALSYEQQLDKPHDNYDDSDEEVLPATRQR